MEQLENAMLVVHWQKGAEMEFIPLRFNPTEFSLDKSAQIAEITIPGLDSPLLQFVRGQNEKLTLELFFDTSEDRMGNDTISVTTYTDRIYELVKIENGQHAPPVCAFSWNDKFPGSDVSDHTGNQKRNDFQCIVESVKQKFTLFSPKGVPLRAKLTVTFREYKRLHDEQYPQLNPSSPDRTHSHIVQGDETLSSVSGKYYDKPDEWRHIAEENNIEDPRRIVPATFLTIPPGR